MHVLRFAHMCSTLFWFVITRWTCQNETKLFTESTWNASPAAIKKKKKKKNITFCPFQVQPTIFVFIPVSFRIISVYFGVIPARFDRFRYHSCPFHFIPASFCLVPEYSGSLGYNPFRSFPFLRLVTPGQTVCCVLTWPSCSQHGQH